MPTPFPGMDPYLERPGLWKQVHTELLVAIRQSLALLLRPRYTVAIEQRTFIELIEGEKLVGEPDVLAILPHAGKTNGGIQTRVLAPVAVAPYVVDLPMPDEITERYLEVRDLETGQAITVIELISPSNKLEDRNRYERKRLRILGSMTNLVEIDLLRAGRPMLMYGNVPQTHYRIVVSRTYDRPRAQAFLFNVRDPIPTVPIPLRPGEEEPLLVVNQILHDLYDRAGYDLFVHYDQPPIPPLSTEDMVWARQQIEQTQSH